MSDVLTAVKSVRSRKENDPDDTLLTPVQSTITAKQHGATTVKQNEKRPSNKPTPLASSPEEALQLLRSQPDPDQLVATLTQLQQHAFPHPAFNIHAPGPVQAQIINTLLNTILPNFWPVFPEKNQKQLTSCLANVAGLNAVIAKLRLSTSQPAPESILDLLQLMERLFQGNDALLGVCTNLRTAVQDDIKFNMSWKELVNLLGSGKVVSTVAQAEDVSKQRSWLSNGGTYAMWLGRNIARMVVVDESTAGYAAQVLAKALNLGYPGQLLQGLFELLVQNEAQVAQARLKLFLGKLPLHSKRAFTEHTIRWLSSLTPIDSTSLQSENKDVSALAGFLSILNTDEAIKQHTLTLLSDPALSSSLSLRVKRALLTTISTSPNEDSMQQLLERLTSTFSDQLFINHAPILQQESIAQTLLLAAGYVHRAAPMALLLTARSSHHMRGVSTRLDCSNQRARWLGMVVATAMSRLVDKEGSRMKFGTDDMETEDADWYGSLVNVEDAVGTVEGFAEMLAALSTQVRKPRRAVVSVEQEPATRKINGKPVFGPPRPPPPAAQTEVIGEKVTEVLDDNEEEEDDLKPYAKPDSDPEDSDEDATLVNRDKPRAPVYIRDLMSMLRDDQKPERFQLGIKHAASLIRRKANFGKEVLDHVEELASILCNLQDPFETEDFDELKLQALIAVLLSDVKTMGPWLSKQAFTGDYSIAQRCVILSALGLGGRELGGVQNEDELNPALPDTTFPSKRLAPHLHAIYSTPAPTSSIKRLEAASKEIEHTLIRPLALRAADESTAHLNAVKVRTFSSRMDVQRTKRKPAPNQLAKSFSAAFFFPLTTRYQQDIAAYGSASVYASVPFALVTLLKTLALLLHASGPATVDLPAVTTAFWDLCLSLRVQAVQDVAVLQAVLFALLALLEVNEGQKRLIAEEMPRQLMETQEWVELVFERTGGGGLIGEGDGGDEGKVRTLAAGVLVKTREVVEAYQRLLVGYEFG